jgi:hypothetical protein
MATNKINLNELRSLVKQIIKEEYNGDVRQLVNIDTGIFEKGTTEYNILNWFRDNDAYKLTSHPKIISFNYKKDFWVVK